VDGCDEANTEGRTITGQTRVYSGAWLGYLTTPKISPSADRVSHTQAKTPKVERKLGKATLAQNAALNCEKYQGTALYFFSALFCFFFHVNSTVYSSVNSSATFFFFFATAGKKIWKLFPQGKRLDRKDECNDQQLKPIYDAN